MALVAVGLETSILHVTSGLGPPPFSWLACRKLVLPAHASHERHIASCGGLHRGQFRRSLTGGTRHQSALWFLARASVVALNIDVIGHASRLQSGASVRLNGHSSLPIPPRYDTYSKSSGIGHDGKDLRPVCCVRHGCVAITLPLPIARDITALFLGSRSASIPCLL